MLSQLRGNIAQLEQRRREVEEQEEMGVVIVKVTIEPSYTDGFAMWVRSQEDVKDVWWKWYATQQNAYMEAEQLGLAFALEIPQGFALLVRRQLKESASIDPAELTNFGFREAPL